MRVYDATGMEFLANYVGPAYAPLLSTLRDRQAVVFGRASSCNAPLILNLNDTDAFLNKFWKSRVDPMPRTRYGVPGERPDASHESAGDDDIPF
jgi:hypothetical protein